MDYYYYYYYYTILYYTILYYTILDMFPTVPKRGTCVRPSAGQIL